MFFLSFKLIYTLNITAILKINRLIISTLLLLFSGLSLIGQNCEDFIRYSPKVLGSWRYDDQSASGYFRYGVTSSTTIDLYEGYLYHIYFSASSSLEKNFDIKVYDEQNNILDKLKAKKALTADMDGNMFYLEYVAETNRRITIEVSVPDKVVNYSVVQKFDNYGGSYTDTIYSRKPFYGDGCVGLIVYRTPITKKGFY